MASKAMLAAPRVNNAVARGVSDVMALAAPAAARVVVVNSLMPARYKQYQATSKREIIGAAAGRLWTSESGTDLRSCWLKGVRAIFCSLFFLIARVTCRATLLLRFCVP